MVRILEWNFEKRFNDHFTIRGNTITSHLKCGSLGIHVDLKNRYVTLHLLWFFILIGDDSVSSFKDDKLGEEYMKLWDEYQTKVKKLLSDSGVEPITT